MSLTAELPWLAPTLRARPRLFFKLRHRRRLSKWPVPCSAHRFQVSWAKSRTMSGRTDHRVSCCKRLKNPSRFRTRLRRVRRRVLERYASASRLDGMRSVLAALEFAARAMTAWAVVVDFYLMFKPRGFVRRVGRACVHFRSYSMTRRGERGVNTITKNFGVPLLALGAFLWLKAAAHKGHRQIAWGQRRRTLPAVAHPQANLAKSLDGQLAEVAQ
mmetsp:Transcript_63843/g.144020  ORF Transcript_63843/g.144020 Transcript_63843/m.144020 type:complete len:216 (+) Transcript_63843:64-711(+)